MKKNCCNLSLWLAVLCLLAVTSQGHEIILQIPLEEKNISVHTNWTLLSNNSQTYVIKNGESIIGIQKIGRNHSEFRENDVETIAKNYQLTLQNYSESREEIINGRKWLVQQFYVLQRFSNNQEIRFIEYRFMDKFDAFIFFYLGPRQPSPGEINFFLSIPRMFPKINDTNEGHIIENRQGFSTFNDEVNKVSYDVPSFWRSSKDEKSKARIWFPYSALNANYLPSITVSLKESYDRNYYKIGAEKDKLLEDNAKGFGTPSDFEIIMYKDAQYVKVDQYTALELSGISYRYDLNEYSNFSTYSFNDGQYANTLVLRYRKTFVDDTEITFKRFLQSYHVVDPPTFWEVITYNKKIELFVVGLVLGAWYIFHKTKIWLSKQS